MSPRVTKEAEAADNAGDGPAAVNGKVPTAGEIKFAFTLLSHVKGKPDFKWDEVATILGLTRKSAGERWRLFRHKFGISLNDENGKNQTPGPKDTKKAATPAKAANGKAADETAENGEADAANNNNNTNNDDDKGSAPATPAKAKRVRKKPATPAVGNNNNNTTPAATPASTVGKKRGAAAAAIAAAALDMVSESESPTKKSKGAAAAGTKKKTADKKTAGTAAAAAESADSSPLSSVPATTADEGSAAETEV